MRHLLPGELVLSNILLLTSEKLYFSRALMTDGKIVSGKATPLGAYPHIKRVGDFIFVSGTSSRRADNSIEGVDIVEGTKQYDIRRQTRAIVENIRDYLAEENATLDDVVDITTFLINMDDFAGYNEIYGEFFSPQTGPARTTVAVHQLPHPDLRIEIKAMAYKRQ